MKGGCLWAIAVLFIGAVGLILWTSGPVDRCLDSGGAWNYETKECEH